MSNLLALLSELVEHAGKALLLLGTQLRDLLLADEDLLLSRLVRRVLVGDLRVDLDCVLVVLTLLESLKPLRSSCTIRH